MPENPDKQVFLQPNNSVEYGEVVKLGEHCYIKTEYGVSTRTHYITGGTGPGNPVLIDNPGTCACETSAYDTEKPEDDMSHVDDEHLVCLNPSESVRPGDMIMFQGKCYTKTDNTGTMTHVLTGDASQLLI
jgi:hypothetical protein